MNRRSFLSAILKAGVAAAVLPAATTYARRWVKAREGIIVPFWEQTRRETICVDEAYQCIMQNVTQDTVLKSWTWEPPKEDVEELLRRYPPPKNVLWIENFSTPCKSPSGS